MKTIYLCWSESDRDQSFVAELKRRLTGDGFDVLLTGDHLAAAQRESAGDPAASGQDNPIERANRLASRNVPVVVVLSHEFAHSEMAQAEFATFEMIRGIAQRFCLILLACDLVEVSSSLQGCARVEIQRDSEKAAEDAAEQLVPLLRARIPGNRRREDVDARTSVLGQVAKAYWRGSLTLVCGAGVSKTADIPNWTELLGKLLSRLFDRSSGPHDGAPRPDWYIGALPYLPDSPLIVAQYLKNGLGREFQPWVEEVLYEGSRPGSPLIDAIAELCRPERNRKSLHSIITFNFDDLIEQKLRAEHINHCPIWREGQRCEDRDIPIYHVHGYLPRKATLEDSKPEFPGIDADGTLVFSEDSYHSLTFNAYSWSNLIQLQLFSQNTCLFIGVSLTDPNLRRLLDVNSRKYPGRTLHHVLIKRKFTTADALKAFEEKHEQPNGAEPEGDPARSTLSGEDAESLVRMAHVLYEMDARNLGISVLWVEEYREIPHLLHTLLQDAPFQVRGHQFGRAFRVVGAQEPETAPQAS